MFSAPTTRWTQPQQEQEEGNKRTNKQAKEASPKRKRIKQRKHFLKATTVGAT